MLFVYSHARTHTGTHTQLLDYLQKQRKYFWVITNTTFHLNSLILVTISSRCLKTAICFLKAQNRNKPYFIRSLLQSFGCFSVLIKFMGYSSIQQQIWKLIFIAKNSLLCYLPLNTRLLCSLDYRTSDSWHMQALQKDYSNFPYKISALVTKQGNKHKYY